jgi:cell division protein FtsW
MGQTTFVKPGNVQSKDIRKSLRTSRIDLPFVLIVICLIAIGLLAVYSTSWVQSKLLYGSPHAFALRQILWTIIGSSVAAFLAFYDYHKLKDLSLIIMGVTIILLIIVLLPFAGSLGRNLIQNSVQPSELAKAVIVIYLAVWLDARKDVLNSFTLGFIPMISIVGIVGGLILIQPDASAVLTVFILGGLLFFFAGGNLRQIFLLVIMASAIGYLVVLISGKMDRITLFIGSLGDVSAAPEQIQRAIQAISRGGLFGVGIGNSITKDTGLQVAWTDSIFAVITEETGLIGATTVIGLYMALLWRGLEIANRAPDLLGRLLASGMTIWIAIEALINISVMLSLIPVAGNALPFISMGGSSMVTSLAAVGIILNISRAAKKETKKSAPVERTSSAASDMRRRNGRRSVSRNVHSASTRAR